jgi:hypothetical protein
LEELKVKKMIIVYLNWQVVTLEEKVRKKLEMKGRRRKKSEALCQKYGK